MAKNLLCIHNARLVSGREMRRGGVVVGPDGRIADMMEAGKPPVAAESVIDAGNRLLFPGFIDAHVHMRDPGFSHKEDFESGSRAAACGGITTVMCMPNTDPPVTSIDGFNAARETGELSSHVDFMLQGAATPANRRERRDLEEAGVASLEGLMSDAPDEDCLDRTELHVAAEGTAACGGVLGVYTGDRSRLETAITILRAQGRTDFRSFASARSPKAEERGIRTAIAASRKYKAQIVLRQVSTAGGFELARAAKASKRKAPIFVEATPHHLHLDDSLVERFHGFAQVIPPLRSRSDCEAAVRALADGTVDFVASDHAPHTQEEKTGADCWSVPGGIPGLDTLVPAVADLAARELISWPDVARLLSETPAALFGLAGRKGSIRHGADGDLVLLDPELRRKVSRTDIRSRAGRSPFEGVALTGWPVMTALRGRVIAKDGELAGGPPAGVFLRRVAPSQVS